MTQPWTPPELPALADPDTGNILPPGTTHTDDQNRVWVVMLTTLYGGIAQPAWVYQEVVPVTGGTP